MVTVSDLADPSCQSRGPQSAQIAAIGRPVALVLFNLASFMAVPLLLLGLVLMLALGLVAAGGLLVGLFCLLFGHYQPGLEALAAGASAFVVLVLILGSRVHGPRCNPPPPRPSRPTDRGFVAAHRLRPVTPMPVDGLTLARNRLGGAVAAGTAALNTPGAKIAGRALLLSGTILGAAVADSASASALFR